MEDQISRTIEDSINVMKDTWSKDLAEIRSLLQELVGNLPTSKPSPVEFQRFCGQNPELWISQAERYFEFYEIIENHKLCLASCYLDGTALQWYQWLFENKQLIDWKHFAEKMLIRFRKCHLKLHEYCLSNLQQWRNITNSSLLKTYEEKSEHKSKMDVHKVFDERLTSNSPTCTPIERAGEESVSIESIAVELSNGHPQGELSEKYVNATHIDRDSNEPQIHKIKTLEGEIPADEVMPIMEYGKSYGEEENDESALLVVSVTQIAFSMKLYSLCKGRSTIVVEEFKEILKTSTCQIANTFIDQRLLTQFQINLGVTTFIVPVQGISSDFGVWDPGISSEFLVLTRSNKNVEAHALFEEIRKKRSCLLVNSYVSKTVETKIDVVDISSILLQANKSGTNDSPVEGSNRGQNLSIGFSVGYRYNASKSLYIAGDVDLLVLYTSFDFKHEDYVVDFKKTFVWPDVFCNVLGLVEQMVVPRIGFRTFRSFSESVHFNNDPNRVNMEVLVIPGSSSLLRICNMPPEIIVENLQVPLPSILYHMARSLHKTYVLVLNYFEKLFYENVIFLWLVCLYSNLEDKVLISGEVLL